jgi:hypothetical protein
MAVRTVRQGTADCLHPCRGLYGLSRGPSVKANRTTRPAREKRTVREYRADRARGPRTVLY